MDSGSVSNSEMSQGLDFLRITNKYFGGSSVILRYLKQFSKSWKNETIYILDVGCGLGDIPLAVSHWARSLGYKVQITGIDLMPQIVQMAKEHCAENLNIQIKMANIFSEQIQPQSYDYVTASLFLHHADDTQIHAALKKFDSIAKRGIILSDLSRSRTGYWAVQLTSHLLGNKMVRHDGPLSVRRAFTVLELKKLIPESGIHYLEVKKEPFFRLSLAGEKL